jgi:hypothetical protein
MRISNCYSPETARWNSSTLLLTYISRSAGVNDLVVNSGIPDFVQDVRDMCSSVIGVLSAFLLLEGTLLSWKLLKTSAIYHLPTEFHVLGFTIPALPIYVPDFLQLVQPEFWTSTILWASTSIIVPGIFGYIFNLSIRDVKRHGMKVTTSRYRVDPLIFNIVKAILTLLVYIPEYSFPLVNPVTVSLVNSAMIEGHRQMLVGSYVGIIVALYEAAQRK